jgi:hypothetical protein
MKSLSPFEIGLVCSNIKTTIDNNLKSKDSIDKNGELKRNDAIEKYKRMNPVKNS